MRIQAIVAINTYAGRREHPCFVVGETPTRYRITPDEPLLALPRKTIAYGDTALVPKQSVRISDS